MHVISALPQAAGTSIFCAEVCGHLNAQGVECCIVVQKKKADDYVVGSAVSAIEMGCDFSGLPFVPDLVHIHALWSPFSHAGVRYAQQHKIPYLISAHGMLAPWALKHKWLKKKIAWWLYQRRDLEGAAMFHVTAECEIKWLRDLGFKQPCVMVPLGSELPILNSEETKRRRDVKTVLFVGRIYPVKGLMNLVRAWASVRSSLVHYCDSALVEKPTSFAKAPTFANTLPADKTVDETAAQEVGCQRFAPRITNALMDSRTNKLFPNELLLWQLIIAGPDQAGHKAEVVAEAKRLGLTCADVTTHALMHSRTNELLPNLVFTGPVYGADKDALHRMTDLFVFPSFTENFGVVVTDALSYGIPVITTKGTPWQELLGLAEDRGRTASLGSFAVPGRAEDRGQKTTNKLATSGRCGWWIDIGVEPLVDALKEAMALSDEERDAMGANGRRLVETKYTWPAIAVEMKRAYGLLLKNFELPNVKASKV